MKTKDLRLNIINILSIQRKVAYCLIILSWIFMIGGYFYNNCSWNYLFRLMSDLWVYIIPLLIVIFIGLFLTPLLLVSIILIVFLDSKYVEPLVYKHPNIMMFLGIALIYLIIIKIADFFAITYPCVPVLTEEQRKDYWNKVTYKKISKYGNVNRPVLRDMIIDNPADIADMENDLRECVNNHKLICRVAYPSRITMLKMDKKRRRIDRWVKNPKRRLLKYCKCAEKYKRTLVVLLKNGALLVTTPSKIVFVVDIDGEQKECIHMSNKKERRKLTETAKQLDQKYGMIRDGRML